MQEFVWLGCSWSWPHWHHLVPACSGRYAELVRSSVPPPGTSPGSDRAEPGCSAAWLHLGGLSPEPEEVVINKQHVHISPFIMLTFTFAQEQKQQQMFWSFGFTTATCSHLLSDLQSSFTKWLCFFVFSSLPIEHCQVVKCCCHLHKCGHTKNSDPRRTHTSLYSTH